MQVRWVKIRHFRRKTRYNTKTVQDRRIVSIKVEQEVVCALSNGYVSDDLRWPSTHQTTPIFAFFITFHIFVVSKHRHFIFGVQVDSSQSKPTDNKPSLKGSWLRHVTRFKFWCLIHILGMVEARALKLCTKKDYIKSGQRDDKSPLKGAWFCSRDPFFVCTAVELETYSPRHSASCYQQCHARRTAVYHSTARLRPRTSHAKA